MKIKSKKCKGIGRAKSYIGCGGYMYWRKYGLCKSCYRDWLYNTIEGKNTLKSVITKSQNKIKREEKELNKSIAKLIQEARKPYQEYIRLRDINNACISCGSTSSSIWDAGHFKKAEIFSGLIFDERNCHKQCRKCNSFLNGNEGEYRRALIKKFGEKWMEKLDEDSEKMRTYKYTRHELKEIKEKYILKVKNYARKEK